MNPHNLPIIDADTPIRSPMLQFSLRQLFCWMTWILAALTVMLRLGNWISDLGHVAPPAVALVFMFVAVVLLAQILVLRTLVR